MSLPFIPSINVLFYFTASLTLSNTLSPRTPGLGKVRDSAGYLIRGFVNMKSYMEPSKLAWAMLAQDTFDSGRYQVKCCKQIRLMNRPVFAHNAS